MDSEEGLDLVEEFYTELVESQQVQPNSKLKQVPSSIREGFVQDDQQLTAAECTSCELDGIRQDWTQ